MRVVVVMRGGLGDIVLAQRALAEVKSRLGPDGELCVATESKHVDLFLCSSSVDRVVLVGGAREAKRLRQTLQASGVAVYNLDHPFSGQRQRRDTLHITERIDEILGTSASGQPPMLEVQPASFDQPHAVLTWASSASGKLPTPADRLAIWTHFEEVCSERGLRPLFIGEGQHEAHRVQGSLLGLCAVIRGASLFVGCDTGFSHVASTAEVPSAICHIGYPVARCGVRNRNACILYYRGNDAVNARAVCEAIGDAANEV